MPTSEAFVQTSVLAPPVPPAPPPAEPGVCPPGQQPPCSPPMPPAQNGTPPGQWDDNNGNNGNNGNTGPWNGYIQSPRPPSAAFHASVLLYAGGVLLAATVAVAVLCVRSSPST
eukprot:TRINITY_DN11102_c1_g1_i1.p3 TRINITY_DN11102_c1_g1~~TRINITY_DN11102_c1_g1_i1.p3  ORF type:complete len:114 (+),score=2.11 TRINITY_DN11102_c1_g1_i1:202-543(+)